MPATKGSYQGQPVDVRPIKPGDKDVKAGTEQVVIKLKDGSEKTVPKAEVTDAS